jgi:hypothetical protein
MITIDCQQGSAEWLAVRAGIPSASNFDKLITTKGEPSKQAQKYLYSLAAEKVSGIKEESFQSQAMLKGIETEIEAVAYYELTHDVPEVQTVGFVLHESRRYGCSPDRLVGAKGLLEVKCPLPSTHVSYLLENNLYQDYLQQAQGQLLVTGRKWCDLMSYSRGLRPLIVRVERDEKFLKALELHLEIFCNELEKITEKIK